MAPTAHPATSSSPIARSHHQRHTSASSNHPSPHASAHPSQPRLPAACDPPSETHPPAPKTWLIFGATGHIGRAVVRAALQHGDSVGAVGRVGESELAQMQGWHPRCLGLLCDVRVPQTVRAAVEKCVKRFGGVDVVVNCTGYGVIAACEDQDAADLRSQLDTNFFGTVNIIHATLPLFRAQAAQRAEELGSIETAGDSKSSNKSTASASAANTPLTGGRYLIFSSTSGALGVPGLGPYCATKYATEGLIESMLYETDAFGIKATLVQPGHVRLDGAWGPGEEDSGTTTTTGKTAEGSSGDTAMPLHRQRYGHLLIKTPSAPYNSPTAPARHAQRVVQWLAGRQPTSAAKSAELVWQLGHCRFPPLRLLLGSFAVESIRDRLKSIIEEIEDWKHLHFPTAEGDGLKGKGGEEEGEEEEEDGMDVDGDGGDEEGVS